MRRLVVFPLLALVVACSDNRLVEPELAISPELAAAQTASQTGDAVNMVPFKGRGTLAIVQIVPGCLGDQGLLAITVAIEVRGTHTGRSEIAMTNCWTPTMEFVETETGILTAANGDLIYVHGSFAEYGTIHPFYPDGTWEFGPVHIVGGTGRFEGTTGSFWFWGRMDESGLTSTMILDGEISSVGSSM